MDSVFLKIQIHLDFDNELNQMFHLLDMFCNKRHYV